jgi:sarcosine oxidase subunit beta
VSTSADIVIIGGGIVGSSIAYHLTEAGAGSVLVLERESQQGKGSTGKSMGGVRAQFATTVNIQMSLYSIPFYQRYDEVVGYPSGYRPQGYLFVASSEHHLEYLRTNFARQVSLGLTTARLVDADEILRMVPQLRPDRILGGSFCSTDGFVDPYSVMNGFMAKAMERGAQLWRDAEVTGIRDGNVHTTKGSIATRTVVIAAGAWSALVAKLAGVDVPIEPLRRMLVPTEPFDKISDKAPMTIDMASGFHFRPEGPGLLMAWNDPDETPGFKTDFDRAFIEKILSRGVDFAPCLEEAEVNPRRAWAGLYAMSPDHHCIIGPVPNVPGLFVATGFSGHGVMHSPATGRIVADLILHGHSDVCDTHAIGLERFAQGRLIEETAVL